MMESQPEEYENPLLLLLRSLLPHYNPTVTTWGRIQRDCVYGGRFLSFRLGYLYHGKKVGLQDNCTCI